MTYVENSDQCAQKQAFHNGRTSTLLLPYTHNISLFNLISQSPLPTKSLKHKGLIAESWRSTNRPAIQSLAPDTSFKHKSKRCKLHSIIIGPRRTELCSETPSSPLESVDCLWRILPCALVSHKDFYRRLLGASKCICRRVVVWTMSSNSLGVVRTADLGCCSS